jgi:membrane glycosyltransferase
MRQAGLLVTPEESAPSATLTEHEALFAWQVPLPGDGLLALATDAAVREAHFRWASSAPKLRGRPDAAYLTATDKIFEAETLEEALAWLDPRERVHVVGHLVLLDRMIGLPFGGGPGSGPPVLRGPQRTNDPTPVESSAA